MSHCMNSCHGKCYTFHFTYFQVAKDGYFSLGRTPVYSTLPNITGTSDLSEVAPYAGHIDLDLTYGGIAYYTDFESYSPTSSEMWNVNAFIQSQTRDRFSGTRMMVAEWRGVHQATMNSNGTTGSCI